MTSMNPPATRLTLALMAACLLPRLLWIGDMEFKGDERLTAELIPNIWHHIWSPLVEVSLHSGLAHSSGFYYFANLISLGSHNPLVIATAIALFNALAIALPLWWLRRSRKALLTYALCATSITLIISSRKIWTPDLQAGWMCLAIGLFSWGHADNGLRSRLFMAAAAFCAAMCGHMYLPGILPGAVLAATVLLWLWLRSERTQAGAWLIGSVAGWATYLPWALKILRGAAGSHAESHAYKTLALWQLGAAAGKAATIATPLPFYFLYVKPDLHWVIQTYPSFPLVTMLALLVLAILSGCIAYWATLWTAAKHWRRLLKEDPLASAGAILLIVTPVAMFFAKLGSSLHYWIATLPLVYCLMAWAAERGENGGSRRLRAVTFVSAALSFVAALAFALCVHKMGGFTSEYGPTYRSQLTGEWKRKPLRGAGTLAVPAAPLLPPSVSGAASTDRFVFRLSGDISSLDWNRAPSPTDGILIANLMEGLVAAETVNGKFRAAPALAERWEISPDRKTYTFHLRSGVLWSDKVPLKAADFVFGWKRLLTPKTAARYAYFLFDVQGAEAFQKGALTDFSQVGIKALDDRTLEIRLAHPTTAWIFVPSTWATFPVREDVAERLGSAWENPDKLVTLGPYLLAQFDPQTKAVLRANPDYYGKKPKIAEVDALFVKDDSTAMNLYEAGAADMIFDPPTIDLQALAKRPDFRSFPALDTAYLGIANGSATVDVHLRRAIALAIDRNRLPEILGGKPRVASSFVPPGIPGHDDRLGLPFDPVRARQELALSRQPNPLLELLTRNNGAMLLAAEYIQNEIRKNLGLEVTIQSVDNKSYFQLLRTHAQSLYLGRWFADFPDSDNFLSVFLSGSRQLAWNGPDYANFEKLVLEGRSLQEGKKREEIYTFAQRLLQEDSAAVLPLYYGTNNVLVKPGIRGFSISPLNGLIELKKISP